jgi:hypothetical protein
MFCQIVKHKAHQCGIDVQESWRAAKQSSRDARKSLPAAWVKGWGLVNFEFMDAAGDHPDVDPDRECDA